MKREKEGNVRNSSKNFRQKESVSEGKGINLPRIRSMRIEPGEAKQNLSKIITRINIISKIKCQV